MYEWQAVDQDGDVIPVGIGGAAVGFVDLVLVDHLQVVVVDVFLIQQPDIFGAAVVTQQGLDVVFLDADGLFFDAVIGAGNVVIEKPSPFCVAELHVVEALELRAQVGQQLVFGVDRQMLVGLGAQNADEFAFEFCLGLVGGFLSWFRDVFCDDGRFFRYRNGIVIACGIVDHLSLPIIAYRRLANAFSTPGAALMLAGLIAARAVCFAGVVACCYLIDAQHH